MTKRTFLLAAAAATVAAPAALAQQDASRDSRVREALRRAQAALRTAEDQQAALSKEKSVLAADKQRSDEALTRATAQFASARGELAGMRAKIDALTAELEALRAAGLAEREAASQRAEQLNRRLMAAETTLNERTQTVASLSGLLERSTQSLAAAQEANRKMYAFGRDLIDQYRNGAPPEQVLSSVSVLGFGAIRLENNAEELRTKLDATRQR